MHRRQALNTESREKEVVRIKSKLRQFLADKREYRVSELLLRIEESLATWNSLRRTLTDEEVISLAVEHYACQIRDRGRDPLLIGPVMESHRSQPDVDELIDMLDGMDSPDRNGTPH